MRRKLLLFLVVGVAGVLAPVLAVLAQSSSTPSAPAPDSPTTCIGNKPSAPSSTDGKIIDEMIAILNETKSEKTFVVTALALGSMGSDAKRALPQLIRNAERLGLLDDLFGSEASKGDREVSQHVAEAIVMLAAGQPMGYLSTTQSVPCANGSYGTPSVGSSWNQPAVVPSAVPPSPTPPAPGPVMSVPVIPGTGLPPAYGSAPAAPTTSPPQLVPSAPAPTPLPAVKQKSLKGGQSRTPAAPLPLPAR
jgi:hypothetical protein